MVMTFGKFASDFWIMILWHYFVSAFSVVMLVVMLVVVVVVVVDLEYPELGFLKVCPERADIYLMLRGEEDGSSTSACGLKYH